MKHHEWASRPPMGWNSWDCYGASVREDEVKANAEYMAAHLKSFGWQYVVVDIQWYEPGANSSLYRKYVPLEMDAWSRLVPAANRFPSSASGRGFKPLADFVHGLKLKFGIHIMRGIPRQAAHAGTPVLGTTANRPGHRPPELHLPLEHGHVWCGFGRAGGPGVLQLAVCPVRGMGCGLREGG